MALLIANTSTPPAVKPAAHLLEIEAVEMVQGTKYGTDEPEDRLKLSLRVRTPGHPTEGFPSWTSTSLSEKARFGAIVRAVLGEDAAKKKAVDAEALVGGRFRAWITSNDKGWPVVANGTIAPADDEPNF